MCKAYGGGDRRDVNLLRWLPLRKFQRRPNPFTLPQMPLLVLRQDFEPCSDRETNQRNKRILESDSVDVVVSCAMHEFTRLTVAAEEPIENIRVHFHTGRNRLRCTGPSGLGRRFDVVANKPLGEPPRRDVLNHGEWTFHQRIGYRAKVHLVGNMQVFKALTDAPLAWTRLPVKLLWSQRLRDRRRALVGGVEYGNQTDAPGRGCFVRLRSHVPRINRPTGLGWGACSEPEMIT